VYAKCIFASHSKDFCPKDLLFQKERKEGDSSLC